MEIIFLKLNTGNCEDYGARFYDPEIERWHVLDPISEKHYWMTPYSYYQNNSINRIDLDGAFDDEWDYIAQTDGSSRLNWISKKGGDKTQYLNVKWQTASGDIWNLGTETWNKWPNTQEAMLDIMSDGKAALGSWNLNWWAKSSGRIELTSSPIDYLVGAAALKWAAGGAEALISTAIDDATKTEMQNVYRVFGDEAKAPGKYWTPVDPNSVANFRNVAELPNVNTGRFVIEGTVLITLTLYYNEEHYYGMVTLEE